MENNNSEKLHCPYCEFGNIFESKVVLFEHLAIIHGINMNSDEKKNEIIFWNENEKNRIKQKKKIDKKTVRKLNKINQLKAYDKKLKNKKGGGSLKVIFTPMGNKR